MKIDKTSEGKRKWRQAVLALMDAVEMSNSGDLEGAAEKCYESAKSALLSQASLGTLVLQKNQRHLHKTLVDNLRAVGERVHERPINGKQVREAIEATRDIQKVIHEINPEIFPLVIEA